MRERVKALNRPEKLIGVEKEIVKETYQEREGERDGRTGIE